MKDKKGTILVENLIFIILNLVFLSILIGFIILKASAFSLSEEKYAKEIVLLIDSAKPQTTILLNMEKAFEVSDNNGIKREDVVKKVGTNSIQVQLGEKGGYTYSYFNNIDVSVYPSTNGKDYVIFIN